MLLNFARTALQFVSSVDEFAARSTAVAPRLGVARTTFLMPVGATREAHYEARLLGVLPWYCDTPPAYDALGIGTWSFVSPAPAPYDHS